jgi:UDP-glucose 4-epimerase
MTHSLQQANDEFQYQKILVIGGAGFIGIHLVDALVDAGFAVVSVDLNVSPKPNAKVKYYQGDFTSREFMEPIMASCEAIYHLGSTTLPKTSNENPLFDISTNLIGTVSLLELAVKTKIKKFVYVSSGGTVYGVPESLPVSEQHGTNPECSYGIVKLAVEKYIRLFTKMYGVDTAALRLSNPYGEFQRIDKGQGALAVFCDKAIKREAIEIWGDGNVVRDFVYVGDAVKALIQCLNFRLDGAVINIGYGSGISLNKLLDKIEVAVGHAVERRYMPARTFDVPQIYLDIAKAERVIGWKPEVSLSDGLKKMVQWIG